MSTNPLVETWEIHNRINLYILDAIAPESLSDVSPAKGRTVGELEGRRENVAKNGTDLASELATRLQEGVLGRV